MQDGDRLLCVVDRPVPWSNWFFYSAGGLKFEAQDPPCQWHSKSLIFAALREDGSLVVWGGSSCCEVPEHLTNVQTVCTNSGAIAAVTHNGKVVTWGDPEVGHLDREDQPCICSCAYIL